MTKFNGRINCDGCGLGISDTDDIVNRWELKQKLIISKHIVSDLRTTQHEKYFCSLDCLRTWVEPGIR